MKYALAIFFALYASTANCEEPLGLPRILQLKPRKGFVPLDQGYRGNWTLKYCDDSSGLPSDDVKLEFTHARIATARDDKSLTLHELVVATGNGPGGMVRTYRAPAMWIKDIPKFEKLKNFKTIEEYEAVFGKFRGFTDVWGSTGLDGKTQWHSSLGWMGFVLLKSGSIRVVKAFLHTGNYGDGWGIDKRHIWEGVFRPTGKPPIFEQEEEP